MTTGRINQIAFVLWLHSTEHNYAVCVLLQAILCIANDHVRYNHQGPVLAHSRHENLSLSTSTHSNANDSISNSIDFASLTIIRVSQSAITEPHHTFHSSLRTTARALDERLRYHGRIPRNYTTHPGYPCQRAPGYTPAARWALTHQSKRITPHIHIKASHSSSVHTFSSAQTTLSPFSVPWLSLSLEPSAAAYPTHRGGPLACVPGRPLVRAASIVALKPRNSFAVPVSPSLVSHIIAKCISYVSHCCNMPVQRKNRLQ